MTSPSGDFQINGASASGWTRTLEPDSVTFTGGTLAASASHQFNMTVQTGTSGASAQSWTVQIADSADGSGAATCSGDTTVAIAGDTTSPTISSVAASSITATGASITWSTNESANSVVRYGLTTAYGSTATSSTLKTSHSVPLTGLTATTTYHYKVESTDAAGNTGSSGDNIFTTSNQGDDSLTITNVSVTNITTGGATVTWQTNNQANSKVDYGLTNSYGQQVTSALNTINHSLAITGLSASTVYHYKITSTDQIGNTKSTSDNTFTTAAASSGGGESSGGGGDSGGGGGGSGGGGSGDDTSVTPGSAPGSTSSSGSGSSSSSGGGGGSSTGGGSGGSEASAPAPTDTTAPSVQITSNLSTPFSTPPTIQGTASDNGSIQAISYSLDGGQNWLAVTNVSGLFTFSTTFSFTPAVTRDDNYALRVRARDASGNFGFSPIYTLVIDNLPPIIGSGLYAVGSQLISSSSQVTSVIAGFDQQITVSAIGGPTSIDVIARRLNGNQDEQVFSLVKNPETGLWSGAISLAELGEYELVVRAQDGANNKTERKLRTVSSIQGGRVTYQDNPVPEADVTVFAYNQLNHAFEPWHASPFGQHNPQTTSQRGEFQYILPPGTYYIHIKAKGFRTTQTELFTITEHTALRPHIELTEQKYIPLGSLALPIPPLFWPRTVAFVNTPDVSPGDSSGVDSGPSSDSNITIQQFNNEPLPPLPLQSSDGSFVLSSLITQPTLLTFLTDWSPQTSEQLMHLESICRNTPEVAPPAGGDSSGVGAGSSSEANEAKEADCFPVLVQSSAAEAQILQQRGRYGVPLYADPTGEFAAALNVDSVPTHVVVDQEGRIKNIVSGVKTAEELREFIP